MGNYARTFTQYLHCTLRLLLNIEFLSLLVHKDKNVKVFDIELMNMYCICTYNIFWCILYEGKINIFSDKIVFYL